MSALDIDCTDNCPVAQACETCGAVAAAACDMADGCGARAGQPCQPGCPSLATDPDGPGAFLAVAILETPVGLLCATLCGPCAEAGELPRIPSWGEACRRVGEHCGHVGCDLDGTEVGR